MRRAEVDMQTERVFVLREYLRIGTGADAKVNDLARKIAAELRDECVAAVEKGDSRGRQGRDQFEFCPGNAGLPFGEIFDVRACRRW